uniref:Uncharacterized protein MANES_14G073500 n=1 Tax=Rhizophora mucronata TaxID=61149 RepID=A0A2P2IKB4_RHIMU
MARLKLNTKRFSTVASIWIQCTSGSLYTFSIYSSILKSTRGYDQSTLDTVSVFKDIGANCGVLYTSATSDRVHSPAIREPWVVHMVGAIQCFAGYFLMWAAVIGLIPRPSVAVMCLFMFFAAHAQGFFNTADVVTSVRNFPRYSGTAVGITKGFLGLSGAILIQIYQTMFDNKPTSYILMLALLSSITPLSLMWFVKIYTFDEGEEKKYLDCFSLIALILAVFLMIVIILEHMFSFQFFVMVITSSVLVGLLVSPLFVAMKEWESDSGVVSGSDLLPDESKVLVTRQDPMGYPWLLSDTEDVVPYDENSLPVVEDFNLWQAMSTVNFWILFLAMACGMGSGLATVNNLSQVGGSLGYASSETSTLVSLWSIWNFLGRFGSGYVSDYFLQMKEWPRPLFIAITLAGMGVGHVVIASALPGALYAGSVFLGVCYGSQWSLMPAIASEIFGVQHMGTIFNTITIASPVGSYIFSVRVVGYIYDKEALKNQCTGSHCFVLSFLIMASATFLGSLAALGLFFRTKDLYNHVMLRRIRHSL